MLVDQLTLTPPPAVTDWWDAYPDVITDSFTDDVLAADDGEPTWASDVA